MRKIWYCVYCGNKIIEKRNYKRKFCSDLCRQRSQYVRKQKKLSDKHKENHPPKIFNKIKCKKCDVEFIPKQSNHIFCSKNCQRIWWEEKTQNDWETSAFLKLRFEIFKRDNFQCQYCGRTSRNDKCKLVIDHIVPKKWGGTTEKSNLITACEECNLGKKDILLEERQLHNFPFLQK